MDRAKISIGRTAMHGDFYDHPWLKEMIMSIPASILKQAGDYLLSVLKKESPIRYSRFYDGTDETRQTLLAGMGISERDADWYSVEALIDDAVILFQHIGAVQKRELDDELADGFPDYEISLTEKGQAIVAGGTRYEFPDLEMHL